MRKMRRFIPSGNLLYVFDAAARLESFTKASEELNVTPAAVSHAMRQLEVSLGASLFHRRHRQLALTSDGERLYRTIGSALDQIEQAAEEIHSSAASDIKVHASITVGTYWLLPRISDYPNPDTRIEMQLYNADRKIELPADGVSMAITNGRVDWPGYEVIAIAEEVMYPVCSPDYLRKHGPINSVSDLLNHKLLHLDGNYHEGYTWQDFMRQFGYEIPAPSGTALFNNYILVVHAALSGAGIGLGWQHSAGDLIASGALVRPLKDYHSTGNDFLLVYRKGRPLTPRAEAVKNWLIGLGRRRATETVPKQESLYSARAETRSLAVRERITDTLQSA